MSDTRQALAHGERSIAVGGDVIDSLLITGDGARVFIGDYVDLAQSYIHPAPVFERVQLDRFSPRASLEAEVDRFLSGDRGYLILEGGAGLGKTTFAAHLARTRGYIHHFAELSPGGDNEKAAIRNLAAQLALAWRLLDGDLRYIAWAAIGPEWLQETIRRAAESRDRLAPGEKIVLVVDALDEAGGQAGQNVLGLPASLPAGVYVICTKRPVDVALRIKAPLKVVRMTASSHGNEDDLGAYLAARTRDEPLRAILAPACRPEEFVGLMLEKSQGSWIYAQYLVAELEAGLRQPADLAGLPAGLWHYYADFFMRWARLHDAEWRRHGLRLMAALAAVQEDMPLDDLCALADIADAGRCEDILALDWSPFTTRSGNVFRFSHATLRDFVHGRSIDGETLQNTQQYFVERLRRQVDQVHGDVARRYLERWFAADQGCQDIVLGADRLAHYGANHLPHHLTESGAIDAVHDLLSRTSASGNAWFALKSAQGDLAGYRRHLEAARSCVVARLLDGASGQAAGLGLLARYALMLASLTSMASNVPHSFIGFAVDTGLWTLDRALGHAEQCEPGEPRAQAFSQLLPRTDGKQRKYCLARLVDEIDRLSGFPQAHFQASMWQQVLADTAGKLAPEDYAACFDAIVRITDKEERLRALRALARLPVGHALAEQLYRAASFDNLPADDGANLGEAFRAARCVQQQLEIMALALGQATGDDFQGAPAAILYGQLVNTLNGPAANPLNKAACLRILAGNGNYRDAAARWSLPALRDLVDGCMNDCAGDDWYGEAAALELLPLVDEDRKMDFYLRLVEPALRRPGRGHWVERIAADNPTLRARLCDVVGEQAFGAFGLAKALGTFVAYSDDAFERLRAAPLTSDLIGGLVRSHGLTPYAAKLPDAGLRELADAIQLIGDPADRAEALAHLACAQRHDSQGLADAAIAIAATLPEPDMARILAVFASSGIAHLVHLAYRASRTLHDADKLACAVAVLAPRATESDRTAIVRFIAGLLANVPDEWSRFGLIRHVLEHLGQQASDEQLGILEQAYGGLRDRSAEREALWYRHLVHHAPSRHRARYMQGLRDALANGGPRLVAESLADVWHAAPPEDRPALTARIRALLEDMDDGDRRHALPRCAAALPPDALGELCNRVVDETSGSRLYALEELCKIVTGPALTDLARRAAYYDEDQLLPALAGALAREGLLEKALSVAAGASPHRVLDAYEATIPWLDRAQLEALCARLATGAAAASQGAGRIDQLLSRITSRMAAIGEPDLAWTLADRIGDPGLRLAARMRQDRFWTRPLTARDVAAHVETFASEADYFAREPVRKAVLDCAASKAPRPLVLAILVADLRLAAGSGRSEVALVLQHFMPVFEDLLDQPLARAILDEVRLVHGWWG